eukprot:TRINITY_DN59_c0_g2_i1.p1 TRINITY_DN59_c0_g2~~TRINITY_DN59_c0_g2_i1.p1  ORF type:complete len:1753 (-),score=370.51 TRINITY_DN59_c0_g2_i1:9-5267(-)
MWPQLLLSLLASHLGAAAHAPTLFLHESAPCAVSGPLLSCPNRPDQLFSAPISALASSGPRACALLTTSAVFCWSAHAAEPRFVLDGATAISVSDGGACALVAGAVQCWIDHTTPTVTKVVALGGDASLLSASAALTCATLASIDSKAFCWTFSESDPVGVFEVAFPGLDKDQSSPVALALTVSSVCVLTQAGTVVCSDGPQPLPEPAVRLVGPCAVLASGRVACGAADPFGGELVLDIAATDGLVCGRLVADVIRCAGLDTFIGGSRRAPVLSGASPTSLAPGDILVLTGSGFGTVAGNAGVSIGGVVCPIAAISDTQISCTTPWMLPRSYSVWVTVSTVSSAALAIQINGDVGVSSVTLRAGGNFYCFGAGSAALLYCWGLNDYGQLGVGHTETIGDNAGELPPQSSAVGVSFTQLALGYSHSCILTTARRVRCWGYNVLGGLGYNHTRTIGDEAGEMPPADIATNSTVSQISLGTGHTCALLDTGNVQCFGSNGNGQLGVGSTTDAWLPGQFANLTGYVVGSIYSRGGHNIALTPTGVIFGWGNNLYGQLGVGTSVNIGDNPGEMPPVAVSLPAAVLLVESGSSHTCVLLANGEFRCFGGGSSGQLGYGTTTNLLVPGAPISMPQSIAALPMQDFSSCVLFISGSATCWGSNSYGQLGMGTNTNVLTPPSSLIPLGTSPVHTIAGGASQACALLIDGSVKCWGRMKVSVETSRCIGDQPGEMPPASTSLRPFLLSVNPSTAIALETAPVLTLVGSGFGVNPLVFLDGDLPCAVSFSSSFRILCALPACGAFGTVSVAVANQQSGVTSNSVSVSISSSGTCPRISTIGPSGSPQTGSVVTLSGANFGSSVSATAVTIGTQTCAVSQVTTGQIVCTLPNIPPLTYVVRTTVAGILSNRVSLTVSGPAPTISSVSPSQVLPATVLTILGSNFGYLGALEAWINGQACSGASAVSSAQVTCTLPWMMPRSYSVWVSVGGVSSNLFTVAIAAESGLVAPVLRLGGTHGCLGVGSLGALYCWGRNQYGQLGIGSTLTIGDNAGEIAAAAIVGGAFSDFALGREHSCVLTTAQSVRCFGRGSSGQLGYGTTSSIGTIASQLPSAALALGPVAQVTLGDSFTCVLLVSGAVQCFGLNSLGQLGLGNTTSQLSPGPAVNLAGFSVASIAAGTGGSHTCIISAAAQLVCWGANADGQLGVGSNLPIGDGAGEMPPQATATVAAVLQVSLWSQHTCAVQLGGIVQCWGYGLDGRLGTGFYSSQVLPGTTVALPAGGVASLVVAGGFSSCILLTSGGLWCFGSSSQAQVGMGDTDNRAALDDSPVNVDSVANSFSPAMGELFSCALLTTGDVRCWGNAQYGQLATGGTATVGDGLGLMPPTSASIPPFITSLSPATVRTGSDIITLLGTGFGTTQANVTVQVGTTGCPITRFSPLHIECAPVFVTAGMFNVTVTRVRAGTSNRLPVQILQPTASRTRTMTRQTPSVTRSKTKQTRTKTKRTRTRTQTKRTRTRTQTKRTRTRTATKRTRTRTKTKRTRTRTITKRTRTRTKTKRTRTRTKTKRTRTRTKTRRTRTRTQTKRTRTATSTQVPGQPTRTKSRRTRTRTRTVTKRTRTRTATKHTRTRTSTKQSRTRTSTKHSRTRTVTQFTQTSTVTPFTQTRTVSQETRTATGIATSTQIPGQPTRTKSQNTRTRTVTKRTRTRSKSKRTRTATATAVPGQPTRTQTRTAPNTATPVPDTGIAHATSPSLWLLALLLVALFR